MNTALVGMAAGMALGFAAFWGGFWAFLLVAVLGAVGLVVGHVFAGNADFGGDGRSRRRGNVDVSDFVRAGGRRR